MNKIKNALIKGTSLGFGHGGFSAWLHLDYGGGGQGFGGYCLWNLNRDDGSGTWGAAYIEKILKTVGVENWEQLKGQHIRVDSEQMHVNGIGNLLKDEWFYPEKDLAYLVPDKKEK